MACGFAFAPSGIERLMCVPLAPEIGSKEPLEVDSAPDMGALLCLDCVSVWDDTVCSVGCDLGQECVLVVTGVEAGRLLALFSPVERLSSIARGESVPEQQVSPTVAETVQTSFGSFRTNVPASPTPEAPVSPLCIVAKSKPVTAATVSYLDMEAVPDEDLMTGIGPTCRSFSADEPAALTAVQILPRGTSPDGKVRVSDLSVYVMSAGYAVSEWRLERRKPKRSAPQDFPRFRFVLVSAHRLKVPGASCICAMPGPPVSDQGSEATVVWGGWDRRIRLFSVSDAGTSPQDTDESEAPPPVWRERRALRYHTGAIRALTAFPADPEGGVRQIRVVSGSEDGVVAVWTMPLEWQGPTPVDAPPAPVDDVSAEDAEAAWRERVERRRRERRMRSQ
ncbi:hypothetical protein KIPB_001996 [Kipferlia bialata]|nr:hypothetical protein KIPB_001996 [Kipferlia bialata]|eukprot:g1996.t1